MPILMWLFSVPFISALIAFSMPRINGKAFKILAVILSLIPLAILIYGHSNWVGADFVDEWVPALSVNFHLSIDSLVLVFLYLTAVVVPISLLAVNVNELTSPNLFYGFVLLVEGLLFGFFMAHDLVMFAVFWEAMLIPLYFIISIWGGSERGKAGLKFLIYMLAGSFLLVAAILGLYLSTLSAGGHGSFNFDDLMKTAASNPNAPYIFAVFLLAFAVKTPLFPFHAWLPDAYYQAPVAGSILLSAILSKAGVYGILRIGMGFFPLLLQQWSPVLLGLAIAGVFYGGFAAWKQNDYKRLIAYSSLSHINFVLVGLFVWNEASHAGAILQSINHGLTIAALFLVAGWLEERIGTTSMDYVSGLAKYLPQLCWFTLVFVLSSVALPGLNNFVGELLILFGLFQQYPYAAAGLALTVILVVIYMLKWMQKVYFDVPNPFNPKWIDIGFSQIAIALPIIAIMFWIGLYPAPVLKHVMPAAEKTIAFANIQEPK